MDILLTTEAIRDITSKYWQAHGSYDGVDKVLCRAQLRKVVEWLEANSVARLTDVYNGWPIQLETAAWQALKAAGEEGK